MAKKNNYLNELEKMLGKHFSRFIPTRFEKIQKETYRSEDFQPTNEKQGNGFIYTVSEKDGKTTFIVTGETPSDTPLPVSRGLDTLTVVYQFDGESTIDVTNLNTGDTPQYQQYTGKAGNPDSLFPLIRQRLGELVLEE